MNVKLFFGGVLAGAENRGTGVPPVRWSAKATGETPVPPLGVGPFSWFLGARQTTGMCDWLVATPDRRTTLRLDGQSA